jgi:hypothetical protein
MRAKPPDGQREEPADRPGANVMVAIFFHFSAKMAIFLEKQYA